MPIATPPIEWKPNAPCPQRDNGDPAFPKRDRMSHLPEELLRQAIARIDRGDAEALLLHALGRDRAWLFAHARDPVDDEAAATFMDLVERRAAGEPVAYLTGRRGFWTLDLAVSPATLIPRPETERLVELALERLDQAPGRRAVDLGTGSGADRPGPGQRTPAGAGGRHRRQRRGPGGGPGQRCRPCAVERRFPPRSLVGAVAGRALRSCRQQPPLYSHRRSPPGPGRPAL